MESAVQNTFNDPSPGGAPTDSTSSLNTAASSSSLNSELAAARNRPQPPPPPPMPQQLASSSLYRTQSFSQPTVNVLQTRTLTYRSGRVVQPPQGFFQWSLFLVSFPFKLIMSTLYDLFGFFASLFDHTPAIPHDYDPLSNIAEFTIEYNQIFGTNHPEFFAGSYAQVQRLGFLNSIY